MSVRKFIFFICCFLVSGMVRISAQKNPVLYAGIEFYRDTEFTGNSFADFNIGTQIYHWKIFAPEVGFSYYWGETEPEEIFGDVPRYEIAPALFETQFSASLLTLNPKLKFGKDDAYFTFSPMYHLGRVNAKGKYYELSANKTRYDTAKIQKESVPIWFWSFSAGFEGLAITDKYWFAIFLNYTEISAQDALAKLDFSEYDIPKSRVSTTTIGVGVRIYYNPFPSKKND